MKIAIIGMDARKLWGRRSCQEILPTSTVWGVRYRAHEQLAGQSRAHVIQEKVETIRMLPNDRFRLTWPSQTAEFDAVHLCTGNLPYQDPYDLTDHPNAIGDPFPMDKKLSQIPQGATVGVVGTGLTSIDVFRYTFAHRPDVDVSFFSRSGTFKTIIGNAPSFENRYLTKENLQHAKKKHDGFIPLDTYMEWFEKEL